jgi:hypothetical protein
MFTFYQLWSATRPWSSRTMRLSTTLQVMVTFFYYDASYSYCLLTTIPSRYNRYVNFLSATIPGMFTFYRLQYQVFLNTFYGLHFLIGLLVDLVKPYNKIIDYNERYPYRYGYLFILFC